MTSSSPWLPAMAMSLLVGMRLLIVLQCIAVAVVAHVGALGY